MSCIESRLSTIIQRGKRRHNYFPNEILSIKFIWIEFSTGITDQGLLKCKSLNQFCENGRICRYENQQNGDVTCECASGYAYNAENGKCEGIHYFINCMTIKLLV